MEVSIERAALLKAMSRAQGVVERRTTIPILSNVLIEADEAKLTFRATDLDIEILEAIPAMVTKAGATTIPAHTLHEIARKLPDGATITLSEAAEGEGRLEVSAGRSRFTLPTLPREDFPVMASAEYDVNYAVAAPVLRRLFEKANFAISTEETRYYLNGVYLHAAEADGQKLRAVATDGHRLARIDADLPPGAAGCPGVIVPRKTVGELRKLLEDDDAMINVSVSETKIRFAAEGLTLTSKVIDGTFPDYTRVIPAGNTKRLEVDADEFARTVDRVSTVSAERSRAVKLSLEQDKLTLSVNAPDSGSATDEVTVAYDDDAMEIGFNAKYLLEIAGQVDRENAVLMFNGPGDPTLVREGDDDSAIYVVMPMRV